jgi:hypothetical protein
MSLLGCLVITEGYSVAYLAPLNYRKKVTLSFNFDEQSMVADYYVLPGNLSQYCKYPTGYKVILTSDGAEFEELA